jgi:hypothetical protein
MAALEAGSSPALYIMGIVRYMDENGNKGRTEYFRYIPYKSNKLLAGFDHNKSVYEQ